MFVLRLLPAAWAALVVRCGRAKKKKEGRAKVRPYVYPSCEAQTFQLSAAVDAIVPGDAQGAGFDGYFDGVAVMEAIEIVEVDG
jgi:hypothetical protein